MLKEATVINQLLQNVVCEFSQASGVSVVLVTSAQEFRDIGFSDGDIAEFQPTELVSNPRLSQTTAGIVEGFLHKYQMSFVYHVINTAADFSKACQLRAGLEYVKSKLIGAVPLSSVFVGVYDADSDIDGRATFIVQNGCLAPDGDMVYQQVPLYPINHNASSVLSTVAQSRALYSIGYCLAHELPVYWDTVQRAKEKRQFRRGAHLIGHGYFIRIDVLEALGGFKNPSCDSSLGFAIAYAQVPITPIPIPDVADTPLTLKGIFFQGVVWFNGMLLYRREERNNISLDGYVGGALSSFFTVNNLRWSLIPVIYMIAVSLIILVDPRAGFTVCSSLWLLHFTKYCLLYWPYRSLCKARKQGKSGPCSFWRRWLLLSFAHTTFMRLFWALPPLLVYGYNLIGREPPLRKTVR